MDLLELYENCEFQWKEKLEYINANWFNFPSVDALRTKIKELRKKDWISPWNWQTYKKIPEDIKHTIKLDLELDKHKQSSNVIKNKYNALKEDFDNLEDKFNTLLQLKETKYTEYTINSSISSKSESTAILCFSDYHIEEVVESYSVDWLNEYNVWIAKNRWLNFFKNWLKVVNNLKEENNIKNVIIWLWWDLISGYLHPELEESNELSPIQALLEVRDVLVSWIKYFLNNSSYSLTIPCNYWNHWRTTQKPRHSTWYKNSYEYMLYRVLADDFKDNPRVKFQISQSYFTYLDVYWLRLAFHHWDSVRFGWWVWWITIPMNKAISQWRKARHSDIFVCWHFHQIMFAKDFVVNGSLIWYNAYAQSIKAEYEKPSQAWFLLNSKYWRSIDFRIYLD